MLDFLRTMENTRQLLCSTAVFDLPVSDHGKAAAQEHWIRMQQMTPTRLCFWYAFFKKQKHVVVVFFPLLFISIFYSVTYVFG